MSQLKFFGESIYEHHVATDQLKKLLTCQGN